LDSVETRVIEYAAVPSGRDADEHRLNVQICQRAARFIEQIDESARDVPESHEQQRNSHGITPPSGVRRKVYLELGRIMMTRLALCAFVLGLTPSALSAQTAVPPEQPVIVTQGIATTKRPADLAWVSVAAETRATKPADAQRMGAGAMTAVQTALKGIGIPADAIRTTNYSLQPEMEYSGGSTRLKGYIARNQIEVRVDALEKLGEVLDAAGGSGATSIAGLRFDVKGRDAIEREALKSAVQDAMARATAMAAGAGRTLGAIMRLEEQREMSVTPMPYVMRSAAPAAVETPISPGEIEIKARVTLTVSIR
jgi:uncharacterized protein YggE